MGKATDISIKELSTETRAFQYRTPMKFGGRVVEDCTVLRCEVVVTTGGSRKKVTGTGEMTMGNAWAWPSKIPAPLTLKLLIEFAERLVDHARALDLSGDPLQITHQIAEDREALAAEFAKDRNLTEPIPKLATLLAASPIEAAVHDAFGRAHGKNSFDLMNREFLNQDLSAYLGEEYAGMYPIGSCPPSPNRRCRFITWWER